MLVLARRPAPVWLLVVTPIALLVPLAIVFARQVSISNGFFNDSLVFFDGIHRIARGQVPHVDFSTPVGALGYWLPYLGREVIGTYAGAIETASLLLAGVVVPLTSVMLWRRASSATALLILGVVAGVLVVPLVPGWNPDEISHAMQYNRWGWGLILPLFLLGLPPPEDRPTGIVRGLIGGAFLAALFLIKITYFVYGSVFLVLLLACPDARRRDALVAIVSVVVILAAVLVATGGMIVAYLKDIALALDADTAVRDSPLKTIMANRFSVVLVMIAIYAGLLKRNLGWQDLMLVGYICASSILILDQNFQFAFLVSLPAAFALVAAPRGESSETVRVSDSLVIALAYLMVLPYAPDWARVTLAHLRPPGEEFATVDIDGYGTFYVKDFVPFGAEETAPLSGTADGEAYMRGDVRVVQLTERQYIDALEEGVDLLRRAGATDGTIFTFDYSNVMPHLVDAPRERNAYSWIHLGRNVSRETLVGAEDLLGDVDYVMAPLRSYAADLKDLFVEKYGAYILENFEEIDRSESWILFRKKPASG